VTNTHSAVHTWTELFEPDQSKQTTVKVTAAKTVEERTTPIRQ
jgi:hypothetical protein